MTSLVPANEKHFKNLSDLEFLHDPNDKSSKLGVGSFASVKLAKDVKTGKLHAVKIISMHKATNSDLHNIKTEITIHRSLDHPNIIKFHEYFQKDNNVYFVLDYAENGNLYSYIHKRRSLTSEETFRFFYQTCLAIQYLHQNDILHRDIKPENLLLDKSHNIKLCDFGWSTRRITEKRLTFCGTYEYMAPEIVHKKPYDYRIDIWSLGVLLYELIHREAPYKGRSLEEITKSLAKPQINFCSTIHPDAKDLILKILKHTPSERLSIEQILVHPWVKYRLSREANNTTSVPELKISPRERTPTNAQAGSCQSPRLQLKKDKENVKVDSTTTRESKEKPSVDEQSASNIKKSSNVQSFTSYTSSLQQQKEKENDQSKEKEKIVDSSTSATENNVLGYYKSQKRKPLQEFVSNLHVKTMKESLLSSRRHAKSSSSLTSDILERFGTYERKTPSSTNIRNKIFENSLLSPTFKSKVNGIVEQVSAQTTINRSKIDISSIFTNRIIAGCQQTEPANNSNELSSTSRYHHADQQASIKQYMDTQIVCRTKSDRVEESTKFGASFSSVNTSKFKTDIENTKDRSTPIYNTRTNLQVKLNLPKAESLSTLSSPLANINRTARSKVETRSPEITEPLGLSYKYSHSHKPSEVIEFRRKTKENQELASSLTNLYKGFDYTRRQASKLGEEMSPSNQHLYNLGERRHELKDINRNIIREKENRLATKEEYGRSWAC